MAQVEDAQAHANLFLETCRAALQRQYRRVLDLTEASLDKTDWRVLEPDCYLLVLALRQAVVSVETVAKFKGGSIEILVARTMARLTEDDNLGDLKDVRDMLTHFDCYLKGKGSQQIKNNDDDPGFVLYFDMHEKWRRSRHTGEVLLWIRALERSAEVLGLSRSVLDLMDEVRKGGQSLRLTCDHLAFGVRRAGPQTR
jgi:hypothetical protein